MKKQMMVLVIIGFIAHSVCAHCEKVVEASNSSTINTLKKIGV